MEQVGCILSHKPERPDMTQDILLLKAELENQRERLSIPVVEAWAIVDQLAQSELGRFIISNRGLDGQSTRYVVLYPQIYKEKQVNQEGASLTQLEKWILEVCPAALATQERFRIFQRLLQEILRSGMKLASIPCGCMDDLLGLNYEGLQEIELVGIDLDPVSLVNAEKNAHLLRNTQKRTFIECDAWAHQAMNEYDVIVSSGLNIYEPDDKRVGLLYQNFYQALKPDGYLISSFFTPPSSPDGLPVWDLSILNPEDLQFQKVLFGEIIAAKWQAFRTPELTLSLLYHSGFKEVRILFDRARMMPTIMARK